MIPFTLRNFTLTLGNLTLTLATITLRDGLSQSPVVYQSDDE